jgi:ribosomal protein L37AE/L43A
MGTQEEKNKSRQFRILGMIIAGVIFAIISLIVNLTSEEKRSSPGVSRWVTCQKCHWKGVKKILDIEDDNSPQNRCEKCGGRLTYLWICDSCDQEFPGELHAKPVVIGKKHTMDLFRALTELNKCPNCKSSNTNPKYIEKKDKK